MSASRPLVYHCEERKHIPFNMHTQLVSKQDSCALRQKNSEAGAEQDIAQHSGGKADNAAECTSTALGMCKLSEAPRSKDS